SNWRDGNSWEVWSSRRGDIARAMFYMDLRYEGGTHGVTGAREPDLRLTDDTSLIRTTGTNASVAYMGLLSTLLAWHAEDPVDDRERDRNDVVYGYQGNRNPFVDHPEWVACLYEGSCASAGGSVLANGELRTGLEGTTGSWERFEIAVPSGASNLVVTISGGSGDADLYLRAGSEPSTTSYDCRPYLSGNAETCTVVRPAATTYHIGVRAYRSFAGTSLRVSYDTGGGGGGGGSETDLSGRTGQWRHYAVTVPAGRSVLEARISGGTGDADIYVRRGSRPTLSSYDCRPWRVGNDESCRLSSPASGTWYVSVHAYSNYDDVDLVYSY
ncbi:MAG: pre-peptidase C-terminal domain-containing protein, partial [Myxococcota bacterium]